MGRVMVAVDPELVKLLNNYHKNLANNGVKVSRTGASGMLARVIIESGIPNDKFNIEKKEKYRKQVGIYFRL